MDGEAGELMTVEVEEGDVDGGADTEEDNVENSELIYVEVEEPIFMETREAEVD